MGDAATAKLGLEPIQAVVQHRAGGFIARSEVEIARAAGACFLDRGTENRIERRDLVAALARRDILRMPYSRRVEEQNARHDLPFHEGTPQLNFIREARNKQGYFIERVNRYSLVPASECVAENRPERTQLIYGRTERHDLMRLASRATPALAHRPLMTQVDRT